MTELFLPLLAEQIACVDRELAMRRRVYPRQVSNGRMTQAKADREIEVMQAVLETLRRIDRAQAPVDTDPGWGPRHG